MREIMAALTGVSCLAAGALAQGPVGTAFTYQGFLEESGGPAAGLFDLQFRLFDSPAGGAPVGPTLCVDNTTVVDGRVSAVLDFGAAFAGSQRYLEIAVRRDEGLACGAGVYTVLAGRQALTAAPYAVHSLGAADAQTLGGQAPGFYQNAANLTSGVVPGARLNGAYPSIVNFSNASNAFAGSFTGNGAGLTGLSAASLTTGVVPGPRLNGLYSSIVSFDNASNAFAGSFTGNGAGLTGLNAANLASGAVPGARLNGAYPNIVNFSNASNAFAGSFTGNGAGLTDLNASTLTTGVVPGARLNGAYPNIVNFTNASNAFAGSFTGNGAGLTGLNALSLATGTVADARLSPNIPRLNAVNAFTAANSFTGNVGIGTASPSALLHVAGNVRVDGTITIPATTRTMTIPPVEFVPTGNLLETSISGSGARGVNSGDVLVFNAPVKLPDGAVITGVTYHATDNDATAGRDISFNLVRTVLVGTGTTTFAPITTSAGAISSSSRAFPVTGLGISVDNDTFSYVIQASFTVAPSDIALIIKAVKINYTVTSPLP